MLRLGETFVPDRDQGTVARLLGAAASLGLPASVIRTTSDGLIVPTEVHEAAYPAAEPEKPAEKPAAPAKKAPAKKSAKSKETQ